MRKNDMAFPQPVVDSPRQGFVETRNFGFAEGMTYGDLAFLHIYAALIARGETPINAYALAEEYLAILP